MIKQTLKKKISPFFFVPGAGTAHQSRTERSSGKTAAFAAKER